MNFKTQSLQVWRKVGCLLAPCASSRNGWKVMTVCGTQTSTGMRQSFKSATLLTSTNKKRKQQISKRQLSPGVSFRQLFRNEADIWLLLQSVTTATSGLIFPKVDILLTFTRTIWWSKITRTTFLKCKDKSLCRLALPGWWILTSACRSLRLRTMLQSTWWQSFCRTVWWSQRGLTYCLTNFRHSRGTKKITLRLLICSSLCSYCTQLSLFSKTLQAITKEKLCCSLAISLKTVETWWLYFCRLFVLLLKCRILILLILIQERSWILKIELSFLEFTFMLLILETSKLWKLLGWYSSCLNLLMARELYLQLMWLFWLSTNQLDSWWSSCSSWSYSILHWYH